MASKNLQSLSVVDRVLGTLGLFLIGALGWSYGRLSAESNTAADFVMKPLALLVIALVTAVGWTIDRLFPEGEGQAAVRPASERHTIEPRRVG